MVIPSPVEQLYEPHARLDQPPCQQAVVGHRRIVPSVKDPRIGLRFGLRYKTGLGPVQIQSRLSLAS